MSAVNGDLAAIDPHAAAAYLALAGWERTNRGELGDRWRYAGRGAGAQRGGTERPAR